MPETYVMVIRKGTAEASVRMSTFSEKNSLLLNLADWASDSSHEDGESIERVFSFDQYGSVKHYDVAYEHFKLVLKLKEAK